MLSMVIFMFVIQKLLYTNIAMTKICKNIFESWLIETRETISVTFLSKHNENMYVFGYMYYDRRSILILSV